MPADTTSLEELELIAANLREKIRLNPGYSEYDLEQLWKVEAWIEELRYQENEDEAILAGTERGLPCD